MMSKYELYGMRIIENDSTLKDFAKSVCSTLVDDYEVKSDDVEEFKDLCMDSVSAALHDDISRTDIDYVNLMFKYRHEIGELLFDIENHQGMSWREFDNIELSFFGEQAEKCFNKLVYRYIQIHFEELIIFK